MPERASPTMGMVPLQMFQLMATWATDLPWPLPMSRIKLMRGSICRSLSSLKIAPRGPEGLSPPLVHLPATL